LKCPELPGEFGPPAANAGPDAIKASAAVNAATFRMRFFHMAIPFLPLWNRVGRPVLEGLPRDRFAATCDDSARTRRGAKSGLRRVSA
jgi:hypothetical protein